MSDDVKPDWSGPPTVPGWYWWRNDDSYEPTIVKVHRHPDGAVFCRFFHKLAWDVPGIVGGEWQGPLLPKEQTDEMSMTLSPEASRVVRDMLGIPPPRTP